MASTTESTDDDLPPPQGEHHTLKIETELHLEVSPNKGSPLQLTLQKFKRDLVNCGVSNWR